MNHMIRKLFPVVLAATALALSACGGDDADSAAGAKDAPGNGTDRAFVAEMVPHHESAVAMALVAQKRGKSEFVRGLADDIVRTQKEEIDAMKAQDEELEAAGVKAEKAEGHSMSGMSGAESDPKALETAEPFDPAFLRMMLPHHKSAVEMAQVELDKGADPELKKLAQDIVDAQQREIAGMEKELARLTS